MKLSEIVASLNELKSTVAGFIGDKTKATSEALTSFSSKLSTLEAGAVAELNQKSADLTTAQTTIGSTSASLEKAQGEVNALGGALKAACIELKLEAKADASSLDLIALLKNGVSGTLAKLNVPPGDIPAPAPKTTGNDGKSKSRADFAKMAPAEAIAFFKSGGKLTD